MLDITVAQISGALTGAIFAIVIAALVNFGRDSDL